MLRKTKEGLEWLEFELLADIPLLSHAVFLRHGGTSEGDFSSLNLGYDLGDDPQKVTSNLENVKTILGITKLTWGIQCHGITITTIDAKTPEKISNTDGFITNTVGAASMVKHADCQAAIFYDPKNHAIANVHSGWRGSVQNIYSRTIDAMQKTFRSQPEDLLVCISPSLGPKVAEFLNYKKEFPEFFWDFKNSSSCFNFWEISREQLKKKGVLGHHIEIAEMCTFSQEKDFFSYRKNKITGRHGTLAVLRDKS
jgi:polyphenol oxidase